MILRKEMTKIEIEKELNRQGDYVQIDTITRFLKENPAMDLKKFLYTKLTEIYERRNMFIDEAEVYNRLIDIALTPSEKVNCLVKATECYIKAGVFDKADLMMSKVTGQVKELERRKIVNSIIEFYKKQALVYEKEKRRNRAVKTYEKILSMNILDSEKKEVKQRLVKLYQELGMVGEYMKIKGESE